MFLLAESGSTKTDWYTFSNGTIRSKSRSSGFNPDIQTESEIAQKLNDFFSKNFTDQPVSKVFFYGAGLAGEHNKAKMHRLLSQAIPNTDVLVEHDLTAAARAACFDQAGIACIIGTGSNSCLYDGENILANIGGQGYLFGDEGSGADLGKELLKRALNNDLPQAIIKKIEDTSGKKLLEIRTEVYQSEHPNVLLASWSPFIEEMTIYEDIRSMIRDRFSEFFHQTVMRYPEYRKFPVSFVGSVAFYFQDFLHQVAEKLDIHIGRIIRQPVHELMRYHSSYLNGNEEA